ncbi:MAG: ATP synthase F1 subunit delta [Ruminococcaceae bacterium]|nr:ATP synthase F1 subunit delta [Oscillospiraceae bacterium]
MIDAKEYGKALFLLTEEDGTTETVAEDLQTVRKLLRENPKYEKLLDTPALTKEEKLRLIDRAFSSLHESVLNLTKILCEKHSVYQFSKVAESYAALCDEARGILRAEILTAVAMTQKQVCALTAKLSALTGKTVIIKNTVDPEVLGGAVLRYAGKQLDGSLKARLEGFEKSLKDIVL